MDPELSALEEKLEQLVQRLKALREENRDLRQQLASRTDENARLGEKLVAAKTRIEALLKQIPETES
jgi:cell division protein ZapB